MKHFHSDEFKCKCGCGKGFADMDKDFLSKLDKAREDAGVIFNLTSAFRCITYNLSVGGKPNSAHRYGHAVDIACLNSNVRYLMIKSLLRNGVHRIGIGPDFIHADDDPNLPDNVIWTYYKGD